MIRRRGRGYRPPYKPPQYVTGRMDDFPLVPETPIDIAPCPILPTPSLQTAGGQVSAAPPELARQQSGGPEPQKPVQHTIDIVVQPDPRKKRARKEPEPELDYSELGVEKLRKAYDWIGRVLSDHGVPPPEPEFPRVSRNRTRRAARSGASKTKSHPASTRDHHSRHCTICNHPERAAIEEEFIHWHDPSEIGLDYEVGRRSVYRHAHAAGLFARREHNMRFALGHMVQQAMNITPTSDSILRAIRAYSCLNRRGQWTEPPAHVVVSSGSAALAAQRPLNAALSAMPGPPPIDVLAAPARQQCGGPVAGGAPPKKERQESRVTRHCVPSRKGRK